VLGRFSIGIIFVIPINANLKLNVYAYACINFVCPVVYFAICSL
jgi:hypothetical protein